VGSAINIDSVAIIIHIFLLPNGISLPPINEPIAAPSIGDDPITVL
jgi:hypothetical protein